MTIAAKKEQAIGVGILGSTGSIGTQALEVIAQHPDRFRVALLTAQNNYQLLIAQALRFRPTAVVIANEAHYASVQEALAGTRIAVFAGEKAIAEQVVAPNIDRVLTALVGACGLLPTLAAIDAGKTICLANKETLVMAGELVMARAKVKAVTILPVDSEHAALFQALVGEDPASIHKLIVTASGGPFRGYTTAQLEQVTLAQALKHPNWAMGAKITVDSSTLLNKGLEVIEARWLFDQPTEKIEVVVHPQSIVHSLVEFNDGSLKAQLGTPDMRLPIQYALAYPERLGNDFPRFRFADYPSLTFEPVDRKVFRALDFAFGALEQGGNRACVLNAANEIANCAFRECRIRFLEIYKAIEAALQHIPNTAADTLEPLIVADQETRSYTEAFINSLNKQPVIY